MRSLKKVLAASAAYAFGLAATPAGAVWNGPPSPYLYYDGSTAVFNNEVYAAMASMTSVEGFYQLCATGNTTPALTSNDCNLTSTTGGLPSGAIVSQREAFVAIAGTFKNSTTDVNHFGIPGGGSGTVFISANGSSYGVQCTSPPYSVNPGNLGLFGGDKTPGNADDAGGKGVTGAGAANPTGLPANWAAGGPNNFTGLVQCQGSTQFATLRGALPAALQPTDHTGAGVNTAAGTEYCVLDYAANIQQEPAGSTPPFHQTVSSTSNIPTACNFGASDVPPQDYNDLTFNTLSMDNQASTGGQIFKLIASSNVAPSGLFSAASPNGFGPLPLGGTGTPSQKISLQLPQIEGVFGDSNLATDACSWTDVGGQVIAGPVSGNADYNAIAVCYREDGSGTRETFRNTFMLTKNGNADMETPNDGLPTGTVVEPCTAFLEGGAGATFENPPGNFTNKYFIGPQTSTTAEANCVIGASTGANTGAGGGSGGSHVGGIGYVAASKKDTNSPARYYAVPVFGTDPDALSTRQLQELVKCGEYPYWAPLTIGVPVTNPPGDAPYTTAQRNALASTLIFNETNSADYLPFGDPYTGLAFPKTQVNAPYNNKFSSLNCDSRPPIAPQARPGS